ncbi:hypothetical protein M422DRAFT_233502 [Sphaerobolus stellatus SS14]|uniref:Epoxide hydrolase N-terminal domain-containing protein n=1 Tax=Sphaerobolus stellatus (strain SS14) TaxID=990650 RepID=A0A0C9VA10_SPHS4|nr:hypothetical protein M422DRAFT_233502 [Sphaerobolus stellatus SS14]
MTDITPFTIAVPEETLSDLHTRLGLTRFPVNVDLPKDKEWDYGAPTQNVKDLVEYWKTSFDWRKVEADINSKLPQFITPVDAGDPHGILNIHFTLAYGLTDSPTGLLAWIYEKLVGWSDDYPWTPEEVITWVMLYWISVAGPVGGLRYYKENLGNVPKPDAMQVYPKLSQVPLGVSSFKKELYKFPQDWANLKQPVSFYKRHEVGGHFAAYEVPDLLVDDIRSFTEIVVKNDPKLLPAA